MDNPWLLHSQSKKLGIDYDVLADPEEKALVVEYLCLLSEVIKLQRRIESHKLTVRDHLIRIKRLESDLVKRELLDPSQTIETKNS